MDGAAGPGEARQVYDRLRAAVAEYLCLRDASGRPMLPTDGLELLTAHEAWEPRPILAAALG